MGVRKRGHCKVFYLFWHFVCGKIRKGNLLHLFPFHKDVDWDRQQKAEAQPLTTEEVEQAGDKIRSKEGSDPDRIP